MPVLQIILQPTKSFLAYPLIHSRQKVGAFDMATAEVKLAAIMQLALPRSLKDLKAYLGLTGFFRRIFHITHK